MSSDMKVGIVLAGLVAVCCGLPFLLPVIASSVLASVIAGALTHQFTVGLVAAGALAVGAVLVGVARPAVGQRRPATTASRTCARERR